MYAFSFAGIFVGYIFDPSQSLGSDMTSLLMVFQGYL